MTGSELREARRKRGWGQVVLAERLGVSQPYVSLLESGTRVVTPRLASKLVAVLGLPPTALPVKGEGSPLPPGTAATSLARLGYSAFGHLRRGRVLNPAEVLARTLRQAQLEARLVEALPWLLVRYPDVNWNWLVSYAKQHDLQNRLGFVVTLARELAENRGDGAAAERLRERERVLENSRLQREDSFAGDALTEAERRWLRANRSNEAAQWNLLSNLSVGTLASA
ncbi:MAG: helix-turn-helix domain-containing protein [Vicinamibacterales bacterium]